MSNYFPLASLSLVILATSILNAQEVDFSKLEKVEYPSEWMHNQRAYPSGVIDKKAISEASIQTKKARISASQRLNSTWQLEGPLNTGGRITDIAISPINDDHFFVGTAVGGVFKTTNRGQSWTPVFDGVGRPSIGNIAIAPTNADRIYVGTGEANASAPSGAFYGDGMYRSDDGGQSWLSIGLEAVEHIARIQVDPNDADRVFVAGTGILFGKNNERGVYRSTDAGENWEQVLFVTDSTACIDVIIHPLNPNIIVAAMWERIQYPSGRDYAGESSGVWRSADGGDTWERMENGLLPPWPYIGRIGLAVSRSGNSAIYASYTSSELANVFDKLYRSDDLGVTWVETETDAISDVNSNFGWYFGNLRVHPTDPDQVWVLGQKLYRSTDGGDNWVNETGNTHLDYHAMDFSNSNPEMMLLGSDGGLYISENGGNSWSHFNNLPITQFYNIEIDELNPSRVFGGTQDNNTIRRSSGAIDDYESILGGDGFHVAVDPSNSNIVYAEYQFGKAYKSIDGGDNMTIAQEGIDASDRNNWNSPMILSPYDSDVALIGTHRLYQSLQAEYWNAISPDLTHGAVGTSNTYATLTAIAASYNNLDVFYTGSDDGRVAITVDGGITWDFVDEELPNRFVTEIAIDPSDDMIAYVTFSGFRNLDDAAHVYKTINGGESWEAISSNLPDIPCNDIVIYEAGETRMLIVANDMGVWSSDNEGENWTVLGANLPMTVVNDIRVHVPTETLYAGTYGRSMYSYDLNSIAAGLNDWNSDGVQIAFYPNPVSDILTLEPAFKFSSSISAVVYDIQGNIVRKVKPISGADMLQFDLQSIPVGAYFLQLQTGENIAPISLIISR